MKTAVEYTNVFLYSI